MKSKFMLTTDFTATETDLIFSQKYKISVFLHSSKNFHLVNGNFNFHEFSSIKESQSHGALTKLSKRTL